MLTRAVTGLFLVGLFSASTGTAASHTGEETPRYEWDGVARIVAVGDVHGALSPLVAVLEGAGLVDPDLAWTGGDTHLVLLGDLVDRGPDDRAILDLVGRLQDEARAAGGHVRGLPGLLDV